MQKNKTIRCFLQTKCKVYQNFSYLWDSDSVIQTTEGRKNLENIVDVTEILRFALDDKYKEYINLLN